MKSFPQLPDHRNILIHQHDISLSALVGRDVLHLTRSNWSCESGENRHHHAHDHQPSMATQQGR